MQGEKWCLKTDEEIDAIVCNNTWAWFDLSKGSRLSDKNSLKNKLATERADNKSTTVKTKSTIKKVKATVNHDRSKHDLRGVTTYGKLG